MGPGFMFSLLNSTMAEISGQHGFSVAPAPTVLFSSCTLGGYFCGGETVTVGHPSLSSSI